jgi:hypothetical protein
MPRNPSLSGVRQSGDRGITEGRGAGQMGWYRFAAGLLEGKTALDVGAGTGKGAEAFAGKARAVAKQDVDPQLEELGVMVKPLESFDDNAFDFVTAIDVVEHVEGDQAFCRQIARIASEACFVTTPLHNFRRPFWPFHVREYTFREFHDLVITLGDCTFFLGTPRGEAVYPVKSLERLFFVERMINNELTNLPTRAAQKLLPVHARYNSHQAVLIRV